MKEGDFYSEDEEPQHGRCAQLLPVEGNETKKEKQFQTLVLYPFHVLPRIVSFQLPCMLFVGWNLG